MYLKVMKCSLCGKEIIRIPQCGRRYVDCEYDLILYCERKSGKQRIVMQNGDTCQGYLTDDLNKSTGYGYIPHVCPMKVEAKEKAPEAAATAQGAKE